VTLSKNSVSLVALVIILVIPFKVTYTLTTSDTSSASATWMDLTSSLSMSPSPRGGSSMVYDVADGSLLLFGGATSSSSFSDTWTLDGSWNHIKPAASPPARSQAAIVYDGADGYVLLFGGVASDGTVFGDTWEFSGGRWTELNLSAAPSPRAEASMSYDASDGYVVLFGGNVGTISIYGDTWKFKSGVWTQLNPLTSPRARTGAGMTYDSRDGYVLLFGGTTNPCCSNAGLADTWEFSGGSWTQLSPSPSPADRDGFEFMAYDTSLGSVVLFGGWIPAGACGSDAGDTWEFSAGTWTQLSPPSSPSPRVAPIAYDDHLAAIVLFGGGVQVGASPSAGCGTSEFESDTWEFGAGLTAASSVSGAAAASSLFTYAAVGIVVVVLAVVFLAVGRGRRKRALRHAPVATISSSGSAQMASPERTEKLQRLRKMLDLGLITQKDYEDQRRRLNTS